MKFNPVSHCFVLIITKFNLLNRVPEHAFATFFVLDSTQFKPMYFKGRRSFGAAHAHTGLLAYRSASAAKQ